MDRPGCGCAAISARPATANIRVTPEGKAYLVDFGLVKLFSQNQRTTRGARAVTPGYAPPEQYGQGRTNAQTDIYALAATLYAILTGAVPQESVLRTVNDQLQPAVRLLPDLTSSVSNAIEHAMLIDTTQRFHTVADFQNGLTGFEAGSLTVDEPIDMATGDSLAGQVRTSHPLVTRCITRKPLYPALDLGALAMIIASIFILPRLTTSDVDTESDPVVIIVTSLPVDGAEELTDVPAIAVSTSTLTPTPTDVPPTIKPSTATLTATAVPTEEPTATATAMPTQLPTSTPSPQPATSLRSSAPSIMWDVSKGPRRSSTGPEYGPDSMFSDLTDLLDASGIEVTQNNGDLLSVSLDRFHVVVLCATSAERDSYSSAEAKGNQPQKQDQPKVDSSATMVARKSHEEIKV